MKYYCYVCVAKKLQYHNIIVWIIFIHKHKDKKLLFVSICCFCCWSNIDVHTHRQSLLWSFFINIFFISKYIFFATIRIYIYFTYSCLLPRWYTYRMVLRESVVSNLSTIPGHFSFNFFFSIKNWAKLNLSDAEDLKRGKIKW